MAATMLSKPGKHGPCVKACLHRECAKQRAIAASICRLCNEQIGYMRWFYSDEEASTANTRRYVHELCLLVALEAQQQSEGGKR